MADLTWDEFQSDKRRAEKQVDLILNEFSEKYDLQSLEVNSYNMGYQQYGRIIFQFKLEVKI